MFDRMRARYRAAAWSGFVGLTVAVLFLLTQSSSAAEQVTSANALPPMIEVTPKLVDDVLLNPGIGLYLACSSAPAPVKGDEWFLKIANIAYYRMGWSDVEPEEGADLDKYFGPIFDFWVNKMHGRVAIRVMAESMHSRGQYVTPKWVFDKGVPSVRHIGLRAHEQIDPVFWSPEYLRESCAFVRRLGRYLDGRPGLEFVDIGQIGEWGEMHLGLHVPNRWTTEQMEQTGYSLEKYISAYRQTIDAFCEAFPHTQVFLNVGEYDSINDYAGIKHIHFRQDGLTPSGPSANIGERLYIPWARRGIKGNYEFHSAYREMQRQGWDLHDTVEKGLEAPISYLNTNILGLNELSRAPEEARRELVSAARRVGFRFVLTRLQYPGQFHVSETRAGRIILEHEWKNVGVAPCYESYAIRFSLWDRAGKKAFEYTCYPSVPTSEWWPGTSVTLRSVAHVPRGFPIGDYTLAIGMYRPEEPDKDILLGIAGRNTENQYVMGRTAAIPAAAGPEVVFDESFENGLGKWYAARGMNLSVDATRAHSGKASLLVEGAQQGAWNLGAVGLPFPVLPGCKYRLSCWMNVETIDPAQAPTVKLGVADRQGKHLANHVTIPYDLGKKGTWQPLSAVFDVSPDAARGDISLEKSGRHAVNQARVFLDDVKLELLEAP